MFPKLDTEPPDLIMRYLIQECRLRTDLIHEHQVKLNLTQGTRSKKHETGLHGPGLSVPRAPGPGEPVGQAEAIMTASVRQTEGFLTASGLATLPGAVATSTVSPSSATTPGTVSYLGSATTSGQGSGSAIISGATSARQI